MFILAAMLIVAGVALFVAAPLGIGLVGARAKSPSELQTERHEHDRALAVQGLRELEFDREMGKLSDADYNSMHKALEDRALTAMAAVENIRTENEKAANAKKQGVAPLAQALRRVAPARRIDPVPTLVVRTEPPRPTPPASLSPQLRSGKINFCPECGTRVTTEAKFCAQCGVAIKRAAGVAAWTD